MTLSIDGVVQWPVAIHVTKQVQKNSIISYVLSQQVWWCNVKQFLNYFKNSICKFMQANLLHHKLFHFNLPFESGKCGKQGRKLQKFGNSLNNSLIENIESFTYVLQYVLLKKYKLIFMWQLKMYLILAFTKTLVVIC